MKTLKKTVLAFFASSTLLCGTALADSPLSSIDFTTPYTEFEFVRKAGEETQQKTLKELTNEQAKFLTSDDVPVGARAAMVNALGWNTNTQSNATLFLNYLQNKDVNTAITVTPTAVLATASPENMALYAYLLAHEDHWNMVTPLAWAQIAAKQKPQSLTINMIEAILYAQNFQDKESQWCNAYKKADKIRNDINLNRDLKEEAIKHIFEYIGLYQNYCKQ